LWYKLHYKPYEVYYDNSVTLIPNIPTATGISIIVVLYFLSLWNEPLFLLVIFYILLLGFLSIRFCKETSSFRTLLFHVFSWSIFHNSFSHTHLSAHLISHVLDLFRLYTNTPNHLDISLNLLFSTHLLFHNTL